MWLSLPHRAGTCLSLLTTWREEARHAKREGLPTGACGLIGVSKARQQVVSVGLCCLLLGMLCPLPLAAHGWYLVVRLCQLGGLALGHEPGVASSGGSFAEP